MNNSFTTLNTSSRQLDHMFHFSMDSYILKSNSVKNTYISLGCLSLQLDIQTELSSAMIQRSEKVYDEVEKVRTANVL